MADQATEHVNMVLTAEDQATAVLNKFMDTMRRMQKLAKSFNADMKKLTTGLDVGGNIRNSMEKSQNDMMRGLRQRTDMEARSTHARVVGERAVGAEQARQDRARAAERRERIRLDNWRFRLRERYERDLGRMLRQQASVERASERARVAAMRETIRLDNYRFRLRDRYEREQARERDRTMRSTERRRSDVRREVSRGMGKANELPGRVADAARSVSVLGTLGAGALAKLGSIGLETRSRIDTAEANLRMFGGLRDAEVQANRKEWLNRSAVEYGFRPDAALNAFTEVLKAGIPKDAAKDVTRSIMGASAGLDLDVPDTTKLVGRLATLTQDPKAFDGGAIDRMLNGIAVVAKVTAADSKELVSSLRRGAGVLGSTKMSVQDLTAFTGVGISAGMQEGKAGTFMDFLSNEMVNAKGARGQRGRDLDEGFRMLGLGSRGNVSHQAAQDPTALLLKTFERMAKMGPEKAGRVASLIGMREWRGEMLQMMKASPMLRQTIEAERDPNNAGHLEQARKEKLGTLSGMWSQVRATFDLAWEAVGGGIEDAVREIGTFFVNLGKGLDFDVIKAHVHTLIDGFVDGLGFKNITEMLESAFGKAGKLDYSTLKSFFEFAQGFGRGLREVFETIKRVLSAFTGSKMDASALGNLTAKVIGFGFALAFISPYVAVLTGLAGALFGFGFAVASIAKVLRTAGLMSGAGAGAAGGAASGGILGRLFGTLGKLVPAIAAPLTMDPSKADNDAMMDRLGRWGRAKNGKGTWQDPPDKPGAIPDAMKEFNAILQRLEGKPDNNAGREGPRHELDAPDEPKKRKWKPPVQLGSNDDLRNLIQKSSYKVFDDGDRGVNRIAESVKDLKASIQLAALTGGGGGIGANLAAAAGNAAGGMGGGGGGGGGGLSGMFKPDGMQVPNWYGRSHGGGVGGFGGGGRHGGGGFGGGRGGGGGSIGGAGRTVARGALAANQREAYAAAKSAGLSDTAARALVANMSGESLANPRDHHWDRSHMSQGIVQWDPARAARIQRQFGKLPKDMTVAEQTKAALWEMQRFYPRTWQSLQGSDPRHMIDTLVRDYERPADKAGAIAGRMRHYNGFDPNGGGAGSAAGVSGGGYNNDLTTSGPVSANLMRGQFGGVGQNQARLLSRYGLSTSVHREALPSFQGFLNELEAQGYRTRSLGGLAIRNIRGGKGWSQHAYGNAIDLNPGKNPLGTTMTDMPNNIRALARKYGLIWGMDWRGRKDPMHFEWNGTRPWLEQQKTVAGMNKLRDDARKAQGGGIESSTPKPDADGFRDVGGGFRSNGWNPPSTEDIVNRQPPGIGARGGMGGGGRGGNTVNIQQTIHGADKSPGQIANLAQRRITEDWNHRGHDLEPELT